MVQAEILWEGEGHPQLIQVSSMLFPTRSFSSKQDTSAPAGSTELLLAALLLLDKHLSIPELFPPSKNGEIRVSLLCKYQITAEKPDCLQLDG